MVFLVCLVSFGVVPFKRVEKGWKNLLVLTADKPVKGRTAKCEKWKMGEYRKNYTV